MKVIQLPFDYWADATTIFPFVFLSRRVKDWAPGRVAILLRHEGVHIRQQKNWAIWGVGVGLIVWWLAYAIFLPVGWNPLRYKAEMEAYGEGEEWTPEYIREHLKEAPYYLWWH